MSKNPSVYESGESGISIEESSVLESGAKEIISKMSYADRELRELNGRLANCIDTALRSVPFDVDNGLSSIKEFGTKIEAVRKDYEKDISSLHDKLQELNKHTVSLKQEKEKLKKSNILLINKLEKHEKQKLTINNQILLLQNKLNEASLRISNLEQNLEHYKTESENALEESLIVRNEIQVLDQSFEQSETKATLLESDLSSEISGRKLDRDLYLKCEGEYMERISSLEQIIIEKNKKLSGMDKVIVDKLEELRQEFENEIVQFNHEFERMYHEKCTLIEDELDEKDGEVYELHMMLNDLRPKYENEKRKIIDLGSQVQSLRMQLNESISEKEVNVKLYKKKLQDADEKLHNLNSCFNQLFEDYKLSLDNQMILKTEIKILKKLIEGEEKRLNITPNDKPLKRRSSISLIGLESMFNIEGKNFSTSLVFNDWSIMSNFISVKNISNETINLSTYIIRIEDDQGQEYGKFYFDKDTVLNSDQSITIWGEVNKKNNILEGDLVAREIFYWFDLELRNLGHPWKISIKEASTQTKLSCLEISLSQTNYKPPKVSKHSSYNSSDQKGCIIC